MEILQEEVDSAGEGAWDLSFSFREAFHDGFADHLNGDGLHAAKINGTLPKEAGAAFNLMAQNLVGRGCFAARASKGWFGGAENSHHGEANEIGEMHGAGVVGEQEGESFELSNEFGKGGFSAEVFNLAVKIFRQLFPKRSFFCSSDNDPGEIMLLRNFFHDGSVVFKRPTLGGAILRARAEADT